MFACIDHFIRHAGITVRITFQLRSVRFPGPVVIEFPGWRSVAGACRQHSAGFARLQALPVQEAPPPSLASNGLTAANRAACTLAPIISGSVVLRAMDAASTSCASWSAWRKSAGAG